MNNIDCRKLKEEGLLKLKEKVKNKDIMLKIIQVSGDSASDIYIKNKTKACDFVGIKSEHIVFDKNINTETLLEIVNKYNNDKKVNGIMLQLPVPSHIDASKVINTINPLKDVDGLTNENLGKIVNKEEGLRPCTAEGIMKILDKVIGLSNLSGKDVVLIGASKLVGLPLIHMLLFYEATVTVCHIKTKNIKEKTKNADIIITATGAEKAFIDKDYIKENAIIIDVSIVRDEKTGKIHGDVLYDNVKDKTYFITPVPGGVGQLTVLELLNNTYKAYLLQNSEKTIAKS